MAATNDSRAIGEPVSAHDGGMQAAGHIPQFIERPATSPRARLSLLWVAGSVSRLLGEQAELKGKGYQALLRTVVEVPFQATAFVLLRFHYSGTRAVQFLQPRPEFGFQPAVLQRDSGRRADRLHQLRLLAQRCVVHQCGYRLPVLPTM